MPDRQPLDVALVIPVYNERDNLPLWIDEITHAVGGTGRRHEIVAVDDASTDGSLDVLRGLERDHPELRVVALAEHAGQTAALAAGFRAACSRVVVTLDADLQNDPADVPALLAELERSSAAAVVGYRVNRHDSAWKRLQSRVANGVRNRLRSEEHTSELQSPCNLVCRLLLEKKKYMTCPGTSREGAWAWGS